MKQFGILLGVLVLLAAGCRSPTSPPVASVGTSASAPSRSAAASATTAATDSDTAIAYAQCMRSNGVTSFPDPSPGGGFLIHIGKGLDPSSPTFKTAQGKCRKLMPTLGQLSPGTKTHPTDQWLARMIKAAQCMRRHGVTNFPDPTTTVPPMPAGGQGVISDIDGAIFTFTGAVDTQSSAFAHAANTCGFPLHNH